MSAIKVNFKTYASEQTATPLIIQHGFLGSLDNWQTLARKFAQNRPVYTLDARNHGKSPHTDEMSYALMAADLKAFMQSEGIEKAHLLGHSMGGKMMMAVADLYPALIDKLIVADIAPVAYPPHHTVIFDALNAVSLKDIEKRQEAEEIIKKYIPDLGTRLFLMKGLTRDENRDFTWKFNLKVLQQRYETIAGGNTFQQSYKGETLFIKGGNSNYINEDNQDVIAHHFPNSTIRTIENVGHWLHAEKPDAFFEVVEEFLG